MQRARSACVLLSSVLLGACAATGADAPFAYDTQLIDGSALFGAPVTPAPALTLLDTTPEMKAFVARHVDPASAPSTRVRQLLEGMSASGFFIDQYDRRATQSAAQTFAARKGNCLAYTHLFLALAREAGFDAQYQRIEGQPEWNVQAGYLVRNEHVNVVLNAIPVPGSHRGSMTIDFNAVEYEPDFKRQAISDSHGASLHYGNVAVDHLQSGNQREAFAYLKRGILSHPANSDLWNNLGALYSIAGRYHLAQQAYETALRLSRYDKTAMGGLARMLRAQGQNEQALAYAQRVEDYQERNPYYHFALAQRALSNETYDQALAAVDRAIQLKRNNPRFYELRAEVARQLGDVALAEQSMRLHGRFSRLQQPES